MIMEIDKANMSRPVLIGINKLKIPDYYGLLRTFRQDSTLLAESIARFGYRTEFPLVGRYDKKESSFVEIIDGVRRYESAKRKKMARLYVIIVEVDDEEAFRLSIAANLFFPSCAAPHSLAQAILLADAYEENGSTRLAKWLGANAKVSRTTYQRARRALTTLLDRLGASCSGRRGKDVLQFMSSTLQQLAPSPNLTRLMELLRGAETHKIFFNCREEESKSPNERVSASKSSPDGDSIGGTLPSHSNDEAIAGISKDAANLSSTLSVSVPEESASAPSVSSVELGDSASGSNDLIGKTPQRRVRRPRRRGDEGPVLPFEIPESNESKDDPAIKRP
jgi:ParB-like nuclease family protein